MASSATLHKSVLCTLPHLIAALRDGDTVTIDIDNLELSVDLSDEEIERRLEDYDPEPAYENGVLAKYVRDFGSAANGAVTNPGVQLD